jgi:hypothetical protein
MNFRSVKISPFFYLVQFFLEIFCPKFNVLQIFLMPKIENNIKNIIKKLGDFYTCGSSK